MLLLKIMQRVLDFKASGRNMTFFRGQEVLKLQEDPIRLSSFWWRSRGV